MNVKYQNISILQEYAQIQRDDVFEQVRLSNLTEHSFRQRTLIHET